MRKSWKGGPEKKIGLPESSRLLLAGVRLLWEISRAFHKETESSCFRWRPTTGRKGNPKQTQMPFFFENGWVDPKMKPGQKEGSSSVVK
jgi:hypothetical protein